MSSFEMNELNFDGRRALVSIFFSQMNKLVKVCGSLCVLLYKLDENVYQDA